MNDLYCSIEKEYSFDIDNDRVVNTDDYLENYVLKMTKPIRISIDDTRMGKEAWTGIDIYSIPQFKEKLDKVAINFISTFVGHSDCRHLNTFFGLMYFKKIDTEVTIFKDNIFFIDGFEDNGSLVTYMQAIENILREEYSGDFVIAFNAPVKDCDEVALKELGYKKENCCFMKHVG